MMLPSDVENQNSLSLAVDEPRFVTIQDDQIPQPQVATEPTTLVSDEESRSTSTQCPDFQGMYTLSSAIVSIAIAIAEAQKHNHVNKLCIMRL